MPLETGKSENAISHNIEKLRDEGRPQNQAIAIAESEARRSTDESFETAPSSRIYDINGFVEIPDNPLSKTGVFPYLGRSIGAPEPDRIYMVLRSPEELGDPACVESFRLTPWIDEHEMLGESAGLTPVEEKVIKGVIGERTWFDDSGEEGVLRGNIKLYSDRLKDNIDSGEKRELSAGYRCRYEFSSGFYKGQKYDVVQRNIRGNHLASVKQGRMGPDVAVLDHLKFTFDAREITMADEAKTEGKTEGKAEGGEKEMTIDDVMSWVKENGPKMSKMQDMLNKHFGKKDGEGDSDTGSEEVYGGASDGDTERKDGDEARDGKGKDSRGKDEGEKKDGEAKDGNEKTDGSKSDGKAADTKEGKGMDVKEVLREVAQRDKLADKLSYFVGTFDHSEMTLDEVANYGVKKLGIPSTKGHERTALQAFLHDRVAPSKARAFGMDSRSASTQGDSEVDTYIKG